MSYIDDELIFNIFNINTILNEIKDYIYFKLYNKNIYFKITNNLKVDYEIDIDKINNNNYFQYIIEIDIEQCILNCKNNEHLEHLKKFKKTKFYSLESLFNSKPFYTKIYYIFNEFKIYLPNNLFDKYNLEINEERLNIYNRYYKKRSYNFI